MSDSTGVHEWQDGGSGPGHMQAVTDAARSRVDLAWRDYIGHTTRCPRCLAGADCENLAMFKTEWKAAKAAAGEVR